MFKGKPSFPQILSVRLKPNSGIFSRLNSPMECFAFCRGVFSFNHQEFLSEMEYFYKHDAQASVLIFSSLIEITGDSIGRQYTIKRRRVVAKNVTIGSSSSLPADQVVYWNAGCVYLESNLKRELQFPAVLPDVELSVY